MTDHYKEAALAVPPLSVGTLTFMGVTLSEWVLLLTLVYTLFLIIDKLPAVLRVLRDAVRHIKNYGKGN